MPALRAEDVVLSTFDVVVMRFVGYPASALPAEQPLWAFARSKFMMLLSHRFWRIITLGLMPMPILEVSVLPQELVAVAIFLALLGEPISEELSSSENSACNERPPWLAAAYDIAEAQSVDSARVPVEAAARKWGCNKA